MLRTACLAVALVFFCCAHAHKPHQRSDTQLVDEVQRLQGDLDAFLAATQGKGTLEEVDLAEVNAFWADLANKARRYYDDVRPTVTLDSRFAMFQMRGQIVEVLSRILSASAELSSTLLSFEEKLQRGDLSSASSAIHECINAAETFERVSMASAGVKAVVGLLTLGISEGANEVFTATNYTITSVGSGFTGGTINDTTTAQKVGNIVEVTGTTVGDVLWGIGTLGIGPVVGLIAEKSVEARKLEWAEDMRTSACILGAFGAVADRVGIRSSVGAQSLQYHVTDGTQVLAEQGKYAFLTRRALKEFAEKRVGIISTEDILQILEEDMNNLEKLSQTAKIVKGPFGGVAETIRHYAVGNEYERACKFAGVSTVAFLMSKFWGRFLAALDEGRIELAKAGVVKDLVGRSSRPAYRNLYARYGRGYGFGPGDEYEDAYGCKDGQCWRKCAEDLDESKDYCFINSRTTPSAVATCASKADCYNNHMHGITDIRRVQCKTRCGWVHHWW